MRLTRARLTALLALVLPALAVAAGPSAPPRQPDNPYPYSPHEPKAKELSLSNAAEYLDEVARFWMKPNSCGACHANFAYLMARPLLGGKPDPLLAETRQFLEARQPKPGFRFDPEAVAIAFALAWDDAWTGGKLRPSTREALERMWKLQRPNGVWRQLGCGEILPAETDTHYTAVLAALAAGIAPEGYSRSPGARDGLTKLRAYFAKTPAASLHDEGLRLWASLHLDGLLTTAERGTIVSSLLARQGWDGGWSTAGLATTAMRGGVLDKPSEGYPTALAVYVLLQAGVPADRPEIVGGVRWLQANQRASGRWFTPAPVGDTEGGVGSRDLYAQNLGTAFAILALKSYREAQLVAEQAGRRLTRGAPGLSLRAGLFSLMQE